MDDIFYMKQAFSEAKLAFEKDEVPVGAVIVCENRIIARAHNRTEELIDVTAHAEMQAITSASNFLNGKYLNNCTIYISLEPCAMCAGALAWSQIGKIVFACRDKKRGYQLFDPSILHPKTIVKEGILEKECSDLLKDFFKNKR